jgi:hypothetical protein
VGGSVLEIRHACKRSELIGTVCLQSSHHVDRYGALLSIPDPTLCLLCCRKNKTLSAVFRQASTLALMEQNYQISQALAARGGGGAGGAPDLAGGISVMALDEEGGHAGLCVGGWRC